MKSLGRAWLFCFALAMASMTGCGPAEELEPCNIATEKCQKDVYYALVRLRGDGYDPLAAVPPIQTIPLAQYQRQLEGAAGVDEDEEEDASVEEQEPPPVVPWDFALQVLGLVTPAMSSGQAGVKNQIANVAAFYASASRTVTVIDRGQQRNDFFDTGLLLHELTHALQDRELSGAFSDGTTDSDLASRALTEGEATFYQHLSHLEMNGQSPDGIDWHLGYTQNLQAGRAGMINEASPYYAVRWFIYPLGARFLSDAWERGGNAGVRHAYATQPLHLAQYMTPHDERHAALRPVLNPPLRCDVPSPGEGWERPGFDRFGALLVYAFLSGNNVQDAEAWPLAAGWGDDLIYLYFEPEDEIVLVSWRIRLATPDAAQRAVELLELDERVRVSAEGRDLILIAGNDEDATAGWDGTLACASAL
jgi:hypothetical protein